MMQETYLSDIQVAERYGVHRSTPWRWTKDQGFPEPVRLSPQCTRWKISDIEKWEMERSHV